MAQELEGRAQVIELVGAILGVQVAFFVIIGGAFWAWNFITSAFDGAFVTFEQDTVNPFTFMPPPASGGWAAKPEDDEPEKLREH